MPHPFPSYATRHPDLAAINLLHCHKLYPLTESSAQQAHVALSCVLQGSNIVTLAIVQFVPAPLPTKLLGGCHAAGLLHHQPGAQLVSQISKQTP